ncbi:WD repeat-containing protein 46 [Pseudozyma hubeiensis SY62]|uniref:WD repeat-containing protein 46 n=1 Tax=Pseudozyma hubeiensis (strain SY62) TaxID=1305764 RepID=R9P9N7_PSEHS|nr:WD repeat-containing protein 46 [Pseudozyma hubeiensis SY62]GAC98064.1 WD repeat-containing protein 46 [Pseudozyma hubeiensis SY62]
MATLPRRHNLRAKTGACLGETTKRSVNVSDVHGRLGEGASTNGKIHMLGRVLRVPGSQCSCSACKTIQYDMFIDHDSSTAAENSRIRQSCDVPILRFRSLIVLLYLNRRGYVTYTAPTWTAGRRSKIELWGGRFWRTVIRERDNPFRSPGLAYF